MIRVYHTSDLGYDIYLYTCSERLLFSSDFDTLEQLIDVGYDDPAAVSISLDETYLERDPSYSDLELICTVSSFEDIPNLYPELFV